ncbi:hypothetical protein B484DRAFT_480087 [Ochromonadaceae sp. CCMP2298]|nr:hypothetical protein B484DRAFT_480087 [Ochromonadaceae sp. CCMP2298]
MSVAARMSQSFEGTMAVELSVGEEQEAKFLALKALHAKKLKSLMTSIDVKDKEIAKMKILGKDNRRAQMIQELRKKIGIHGTIHNMIRDELQKRTEQTAEDTKSLILRKTIGAPMRFRPLTREQLETRIVELEKKLTKKPPAPAPVPAEDQSEAQPKSQSQSHRYERGEKSEEKFEDVGRFMHLVEELDELRHLLRAKDAVVDAQKEEIVRLRSRNSQLEVMEEEGDVQKEAGRRLGVQCERLQGELGGLTAQLAEALEASMRLKADRLLQTQGAQAEREALHKQSDSYMRQNSQLLTSIARLEGEKERHSSRVQQTVARTSNVEGEAAAKNAIIKTLEGLAGRLDDKLTKSEKGCEEVCPIYIHCTLYTCAYIYT